MPERIHRQRTAGWRMPEGAVYVGRPTKWGNPFAVGAKLPFPLDEVFGPVVRDRAHAVRIFTAYAQITVAYRDLCVRDLAGKDLACWCLPGEPCHADILLEMTNAQPRHNLDALPKCP